MQIVATVRSASPNPGMKDPLDVAHAGLSRTRHVQGFVGRALGEPGLKPTVRVGEAALREVAAFLLDYGNFAGVPNTVLVRVRHPIFHRAAPATGKILHTLSHVPMCTMRLGVLGCPLQHLLAKHRLPRNLLSMMDKYNSFVFRHQLL